MGKFGKLFFSIFPQLPGEGQPDLHRELQIPVGTAGPPPELQIPVGTAGPQPRVAGGHCRTSTATSRSQWALPGLNRELQIPVGTAGPQRPDRMPEDMPDGMSDRMPEDMSDRMPEDLPVRKCINVMVRITRSKVIQLSGIREAICCRYNKLFTQWKVWVSWHYPTSPDVGELL